MTDLGDVWGDEAERPDPPQQRPEPEPDDLDVDVESVLAQLGGSAGLVQVWRFGIDGNRELVASYQPEDFSLDVVGRDHGPGRYIMRIKDTKGSWIGGTNQRFAIADTYGGRGRRPAARRDDEDDAPPWALRLIEALTVRQAPAAASDPMELAAKMGAIGASQMSAMLGVLGPLFEGMAKPRGSGGPSVEKLLELLTKGIELGRQVAGDEGGGGSSRVLTALGSRLLERMDTAGPGDAGAAAAGPAPAALPNPERPQMQPADTDSPFAALAPAMPQLLGLAARRVDVGEWAPVIALHAPGAVDLLAAVAARRGPDQALATFLRTWPQATEHQGWFRELLAELLDDDDDDGEPDDAPAE